MSFFVVLPIASGLDPRDDVHAPPSCAASVPRSQWVPGSRLRVAARQDTAQVLLWRTRILAAQREQRSEWFGEWRGPLNLGKQVSVTAWMLATTLTVPRHACPDLDEDAKVSDEIVPGRLAARQAESVLPGAYAVPRA